MEQKTTQAKIQALNEVMEHKLDLIAAFIGQGRYDEALIEIGAVHEYRRLILEATIKALPAKTI